MKRAVLLGLLGAAGAATVLSAQIVSSAGVGGTAPSQATNGMMVLHTQMDLGSGNGAPDQDFEAAYNGYDAEGADDFDVNWADGWDISQINTTGTTGTPGASTVNLNFYSDNGGTPLGGTLACNYANVVPTTDNTGSFVIDLPSNCSLPQGLHWVAIQTSQNFAANGQHFWSNRTAANFANAVWRNPLDGFGSGCTDWDTMVNCAVGGSFPDFMFSVVGDLGVPPSNPIIEVPTLDKAALAGLALLLLAAGIVAVRRFN
ncbi:MAG: IPTL-CTERM sorting domain-containing protein [Thermoanaerobaculia bacterium]|nr:IPTL-CTERM sorting domain-containing protein [Thermoanaerobaculia bacterium]